VKRRRLVYQTTTQVTPSPLPPQAPKELTEILREKQVSHFVAEEEEDMI
jgi:hypothetical protein